MNLTNEVNLPFQLNCPHKYIILLNANPQLSIKTKNFEMNYRSIMSLNLNYLSENTIERNDSAMKQ